MMNFNEEKMNLSSRKALVLSSWSLSPSSRLAVSKAFLRVSFIFLALFLPPIPSGEQQLKQTNGQGARNTYLEKRGEKRAQKGEFQ